MPAETPIPILLYHRLGRPPRGAYVPGQFVSPRLFRRHLAFLRGRGYQGLSLTEFLSAARPPKPVVITFDDGYRSLHEYALPALVEYGFPATIFMVAGGVGGQNYWETAVGDVAEPMLEASQMAEMQAAGISFGSHTVNHPHLTALSPAEVRTELVDSRRRLEDLLGKPCLTLAYPYGDWNRAVRDAAGEAGYEVACTTLRAAARAGDDPLALPRINVRRYNLLPRFAYKLWQARRREAPR